MADLLPDWASGIFDAINTDAGFDFSGLANSFLGGGGGGRQPSPVQMLPSANIAPLIGPGGILYSTGPVGGGGGSGGGGAGRDVGGGVSISFHSIRDKMFAKLGFRPRRKT